MQFYLQASIVEKGVTSRQYNASRLDVVTGCIFTDIVAWFIIVACASTLYTCTDTTTSATRKMRPRRSIPGGGLRLHPFRHGIVHASLFADSICRSPTPTRFVGPGIRVGVGKRLAKPSVLLACTPSSSLREPVVILLPNIPWVKISILSQVVNGVVLPLSCVFMLLLVNKKDLMGEYVSTPALQLIAL